LKFIPRRIKQITGPEIDPAIYRHDSSNRNERSISRVANHRYATNTRQEKETTRVIPWIANDLNDETAKRFIAAASPVKPSRLPAAAVAPSTVVQLHHPATFHSPVFVSPSPPMSTT